MGKVAPGKSDKLIGSALALIDLRHVFFYPNFIEIGMGNLSEWPMQTYCKGFGILLRK